MQKVCGTCDHFPNDNHCIGCRWDGRIQGNTKWELKCGPVVIERKVIEDIKSELISEYNEHTEEYGYIAGIYKAIEVIDKHIEEEQEE